MATATYNILFGSFECTLPRPIVVPSMAVLKPCKIEAAPKDPFAQLEKDLAPYFERRKHATIKVAKNGLAFFKRKSEKQIARIEARARKIQEEERAFQMAPPFMVSKISVAGGPMPSDMGEADKRGIIHTVPSAKKRIVHKRVYKSESALISLIKQIKNIAAKNSLQVEVVGNKKMKVSYTKGTKVRARVQLLHMNGERKQVDTVLEPWHTFVLRSLARTSAWGDKVDSENVRRGDSGLVLNPAILHGNRGRYKDDMFIVRGSCEGTLLDARSKITHSVMMRMTHYSIADKFWAGINSKWAQLRNDVSHECTADVQVEECGEVATIVAQSVMPCYKMTCGACIKEFADKSDQDLCELIYRKLGASIGLMENTHPRFTNVIKYFKLMESLMQPLHDGSGKFDEIFRNIGHRNLSPFKYINVLNEFFMRGKENDALQWSEAYSALLELARYQRNRTENIAKGDLKSFRNKISGKANYNLYLSCDNQLDKNASFVWGQREYHAKRFFSNFFEEIDPAGGYEKYQIRKFPDGVRKLSINNLIVSLDLAAFRRQMEGEYEAQPNISKACVSSIDGNFLYPCCCVTQDDGSAVKSTIYPPTKKHLVIGNSGDAKYVDLPKGDSEMLYIAKDGFCYINIYLAMLINVKEDDAKDFTKKVRDLCVPKLGKWPSLMDVATTCAQLRIFYPDVHDAELPRILVDHKTQTCHVVDSFGSMTTGYHILKASTVSQLVLFANDSLESDIKHYRVGGKLTTPPPSNADFLSSKDMRCNKARFSLSEYEAVRLLIKGVFRPKVMRQLLLDEPYIMLLSLVSPGVLMAMFNNGSFEIATQLWINEKQSLAKIAVVLSNLAKKVSLADTLLKQMQIIESSAEGLLQHTNAGFQLQHTYLTALTLLQRLSDKAAGDLPLVSSGFLNYETDVINLMEKNYLDLLAEGWSDLTWREKLSAIWHARRSQRDFSKPLKPENNTDFGGMYDISPGVVLRKTMQRVSDKISTCKNRVKECVTIRCVDFTSNIIHRLIARLPSVINMLNTFFIISFLVSMSYTLQSIVNSHVEHKRQIAQFEFNRKEAACESIYTNLQRKIGREPTWDEYLEFMQSVNEELFVFLKGITEGTNVTHQKSESDLKSLEQIVAFVTLIIMVFDAERSDCVFKALNKFKGVVSSLNSNVRHQSLDDILEDFDDRNQIVNIELDDDSMLSRHSQDVTFIKWWNNQVSSGNTIAHYRTEGLFMEFTRANAAKVASDIAMSEQMDFLIRGAVGSGKSTGLPFNLCNNGKVLLIEPTRPLAENVFKQLLGAPFFSKPTLRMRGSSTFGSSPITVMTSGFALHFYANNVEQLRDLKFIIFDECHVLDASAMAFRSLIATYHRECKVIKTSATPPGREVEFTTQHPVKLKIEESLSFNAFVEAQGKGTNADIIQHGSNILVYVASYNEVDQLSKMLVDKQYSVTKVDGRTMKHGNLEIVTHGTTQKPHFVVATNIIENGVTLDIDVVVDFGMKVTPVLDIDNRSVSYSKICVSYGERIQRLGRVGRIQPGTALRIGNTEKGLVEIPSMISTEAALYCFAYNLPVMTSTVSTSLISNCTVRQVKTMHQFELSPFFSFNFVAFDGTMHPEIHEILKKYKLRDSITALCGQSVPYKASSKWLRSQDYERIGVRLDLPADVKIAFNIKDVPPKLHEQLWDTVLKFKNESIFPTIRSSSISKISYTLSTDINSISRTLNFIEQLLEEERTKQNEFRSLLDHGCHSLFSIVGITNTLRAKYSKDYTEDNIRKLEAAKGQLKEFNNLRGSGDESQLIRRFEALQFVHHQSSRKLASALSLKGVWCKSLITKDILVVGAVIAGGAALLWKWFTQEMTTVCHQGKLKSKRIQALKFRHARDKRSGFEINNNEDTIEEYFGSAYTKKGKGRGTKVGMGKSHRKFINMYGFEPGDYSYIRFVDPLTGAQIEENVYADIADIQRQLGEIRQQMVADDEIDSQLLNTNTTIHAYFMKDFGKKALKVDLTPHNPLRVSDKASTIMKYPEREGELRQTGKAVVVNVKDVPEAPVEHESKSLLRGLRDYNPIAQTICQLTVFNDTGSSSTFGIGFGAYIIANHHLFKSFNGRMEIRSHHGLFRVPNLKSLSVRPIKGRDMIIVKMPKDFPVFPQRLHFRQPTTSDRICMIGSNFQLKTISSMITETSATHPVNRSTFWKHWIATDDGHCGLPVVSTADGMLVGIHSLANNMNSENYYAAFDADFEEEYLRTNDHEKWVKDWKYNPDTVLWGSLKLTNNTPTGMFKTTKILEDLNSHLENEVREQSQRSMWMLEALKDNLVAVSYMKNQLVTRHVVKGECIHFSRYLAENKDAADFFKPLMSFYGKSVLSQEAYIKDIMKYSEPIEIGVVDCDAFEEAVCRVILYLKMKGFRQCAYITDERDIFQALNMKAAVGAMYGGKKQDYFKDYTEEDKEQILKESCLRLYKGELGVWNGSLKAELRSIEKIKQHKTRTFTAAPLDTLLAGKVCVDDFNNQFYSMHTQCCWTVGMTKFYGGWDRLLRSLPDDWIYCDADGSRFDSSLTPYLINAVLSIRSTYMEDWDIGLQMLKNLYTEIVYTPIATPDGTIVKKFRGNNSGQPSTVVDNSLMVVLAMHYSFVKEGITFEEFENVCKFFVNGDDLLIGVDPKYEYLLDNLQVHFSELGLNYQFDSRTRNKSDLWFMSHRGLVKEGLYIPKLEEERVVSILQWDRATTPANRLEAICAAMIEAWGYPELIHQIRLFYKWLLEQEPFNSIQEEGEAPYICSLALEKLYLNKHIDDHELQAYTELFANLDEEFECDTFEVHHQAEEKMDAGLADKMKGKQPAVESSNKTTPNPPKKDVEKDINAGTSGTHSVPRIKSITSKMRMPKSKGKSVLNLNHLLEYTPAQVDISNTRATQGQFDTWYESVRNAYDVQENEMGTLLNGLMVWCIENGTSPNVNGVWTMMDGEEQVEYPLKPVIENAKPTFRQIMAHFSDIAEAYIEMRNKKEPYMPRYGLVRNLRDMNLARYAFDFYEITSRTSVRAREAHIQMKAAALKSAQTRMFGLDGGISTTEENTERHTTEDVNSNMHTLLGVRNM
ncbi:polyprotein [Mashua virus Y]|uniref:Genome polyprotein n=1 Tax=Mashua virus Y TaxID=2293720 RepID=A0A346A693_9POTV|nr:polyprotein [Mashua virus Y]AXK90538.1 polyprotein [Mashua virus Y]